MECLLNGSMRSSVKSSESTISRESYVIMTGYRSLETVYRT